LPARIAGPASSSPTENRSFTRKRDLKTNRKGVRIAVKHVKLKKETAASAALAEEAPAEVSEGIGKKRRALKKLSFSVSLFYDEINSSSYGSVQESCHLCG
jgi:hypothetical protein